METLMIVVIVLATVIVLGIFAGIVIFCNRKYVHELLFRHVERYRNDSIKLGRIDVSSLSSLDWEFCVTDRTKRFRYTDRQSKTNVSLPSATIAPFSHIGRSETVTDEEGVLPLNRDLYLIGSSISDTEHPLNTACYKAELETFADGETESDKLLMSPNKRRDDDADSSACVRSVRSSERGLSASYSSISHHSSDETVPKQVFDSSSDWIDIISEQLDWETIFRHLAKTIGQDWRLFITCLYGNSRNKIDKIEARICQIEQTTKNNTGANNSIFIVLDQLRAWKEWEGSYVDYRTIYKALADIQQNECLHELQKYMRNPPRIKTSVHNSVNSFCRQSLKDLDSCAMLSQNSIEEMSLNTQLSCGTIRKTVEERHYRLERIGDGEEQAVESSAGENVQHSNEAMNLCNAKSVCTETEQHLPLTFCNFHPETMDTKLESRPGWRNSTSTIRGCKKKLRKKKRKNKKVKHLYLSTESLSSDTFLLMARALLESKAHEKPIPRDMYETLMRNTVLDLAKDAKLPVVKVLLLKHQDFIRRQRIETPHEVLYITYVGQKRLVFSQPVFEALEVYIKARERILNKVQREKKEEDLLFITFDGEPQLEKMKERQIKMEDGNSEESSDDSNNVCVEEPLSTAESDN